MNPRVSVIIPTYNCAQYLPGAIESVIAQTFRDYELIVVDDGSTDETAEVIKKYGDRIKYLYQENSGPGAAKNLGIKASGGSFVATLDADDRWQPQKIEIQYEYMRCHPEVGLVYANCSTFNKQGIVTEAYDGKHRIVYQGDIFDKLIVKNFIASITIMVRKECLDKVGLFPEDFMISEDWHLWLRIAKNYPIGYIDQPLAMYRWQKKSLTWDYAKSYPYRLRVLDEIKELFSDYFKTRKSLIRRAYSDLFMRYGYALYKSDDYKNAWGKFILSIYNSPFQYRSYLYLIGLLVPKKFRARIAWFKIKLGIRFMPAE